MQLPDFRQSQNAGCRGVATECRMSCGSPEAFQWATVSSRKLMDWPNPAGSRIPVSLLLVEEFCLFVKIPRLTSCPRVILQSFGSHALNDGLICLAVTQFCSHQVQGGGEKGARLSPAPEQGPIRNAGQPATAGRKQEENVRLDSCREAELERPQLPTDQASVWASCRLVLGTGDGQGAPDRNNCCPFPLPCCGTAEDAGTVEELRRVGGVIFPGCHLLGGDTLQQPPTPASATCHPLLCPPCRCPHKLRSKG